MKKKLLLISVLVASLSCSAFTAACSGGEQPAGEPPAQSVTDNEYTLSFDSLGGSPVEAQTYKTYQYLYAPADPVREGYRFEGWYWDSEYTREFIFEGNTMLPSDVTVYAKWAKYYTLTFDTDGGSQVGDIIVEQGETATPPAAPVREGYVFEGWFADESGTRPFDFASVTSDAAVYAKWRAEQKGISVTFHRNSPLIAADEVTSAATADEGDDIDGGVAADFEEEVNASLSAPAGNVFVFGYWSLDSEGRQPVGTTVPYAEGGSLDLYARWIVSSKYCVLTFTGGSEGVLTVYARKNAPLSSEALADIRGYYGADTASFTAQDGSSFALTSVVERNLTLSPEVSSSDFEFVAEGTGYKLVKYGGAGSEVVIPSTYNGLPVTAIGQGAFTGALNSVAIPDSVRSVEAGAFEDTGLSSVEGGRYISYIGENAFAGCSVGTAIGGVLYLGDDCRAVIGYAGGTEITLPSSVIVIADGAFRDAVSLASISFSRGCALASIPANAFNGCSSLESVDLSALSPAEIGTAAFENCLSLTSVTLPATVGRLGNYAFGGCASLGQISMPGVSSIGAYAFSGCGLQSLDLSALALTEVAEGTFSGCASLEEISLPQRVMSIGARAFENCASLQTVIVNATSGARLSSIGQDAFAGCPSLRTLILFAALNGGNVAEIAGGEAAFEGCADDLVIFVAEGAPAYDATSVWYNAEEDEMYSYAQIYAQSYPGLTFLEADASLPVISIPSRSVMYSQSDQKITAQTDVLSLLLENGLTATDKGEGEVVFSIDSVTRITPSASVQLAFSSEGLYDLTECGMYQVIVRASDRFGNSYFEIVRISIVK